MSEPNAIGQPDKPMPRQTLSGISSDLAYLRKRGIAKVARKSRALPMYLPSRQPAGRDLRFVDRETLGAAANLIEYREALPPRTVSAGGGRCSSRACSAGERETIEAPPVYACSVDHGVMVTDGVLFHGVLAGNNRLVTEVSADYASREGDWTSYKKLKRLPPRIDLDNGVVSLLSGGGAINNIGHWFYDVLPRLHLLRRAGLVPPDARYLTPPTDAEFMSTSLRLLGVSPGDCIGVSSPVAIAGDTMVASSGHRIHGRVEPWIPQFLRDSFGREAAQSGLRLYVNRRDTKSRRLLNEGALESVLAQRGFRSVSAADFDFEGKVDLFGSAEIIVAPHGAGLTSIAFCPPGTHVVEIYHDDWFHPYFEDIARAMDLPHTAVRALRTVSPAWLPDELRHVEVDVERVVSTVDEILT